MDYVVSGPHKIPTRKISKGIIHLDLRKEAIKHFWDKARKETELPIDTAVGYYIYAVRAGPGIMPWYVGQAKKSFGLEIFSLANQKKYETHFNSNNRKGTPVILFVIRQTPKGKMQDVKLSHKEADWVEDYLIRCGLNKNPDLLNKQNTLHFTTVTIPGIHNANAKTQAEKDLQKIFKRKESDIITGFTKPIGKFHKQKAQSA